MNNQSKQSIIAADALSLSGATCYVPFVVHFMVVVVCFGSESNRPWLLPWLCRSTNMIHSYCSSDRSRLPETPVVSRDRNLGFRRWLRFPRIRDTLLSWPPLAGHPQCRSVACCYLCGPGATHSSLTRRSIPGGPGLPGRSVCPEWGSPGCTRILPSCYLYSHHSIPGARRIPPTRSRDRKCTQEQVPWDSPASCICWPTWTRSTIRSSHPTTGAGNLRPGFVPPSRPWGARYWDWLWLVSRFAVRRLRFYICRCYPRLRYCLLSGRLRPSTQSLVQGPSPCLRYHHPRQNRPPVGHADSIRAWCFKEKKEREGKLGKKSW